jgi:hypothetical protein
MVEMNCNLIIHHDVHEGNTFFRYEDDDDLLPPLAWETGGLSSAPEGPADINRRVLVDPEALNRDLAHFIYKLRQLNNACPGTLEKNTALSMNSGNFEKRQGKLRNETKNYLSHSTWPKGCARWLSKRSRNWKMKILRT